MGTRKNRIPVDVIRALEGFSAARSDTDGVWDCGHDAPVEDDLTAYLNANPIATESRFQAREIISRYVLANKLQPKKNQQSLFDPEALVHVGNSQVISMRIMRPRHIRAAMQVRTMAHLVESNDYVRDMNYWNSRLEVSATEEESLEDIERREFDWFDEG